MQAQGPSSRTVFTDTPRVVSPSGYSSSQVMKINDLIPALFHTGGGWVAFGSFGTGCVTGETLVPYLFLLFVQDQNHFKLQPYPQALPMLNLLHSVLFSFFSGF